MITQEATPSAAIYNFPTAANQKLRESRRLEIEAQQYCDGVDSHAWYHTEAMTAQPGASHRPSSL